MSRRMRNLARVRNLGCGMKALKNLPFVVKGEASLALAKHPSPSCFFRCRRKYGIGHGVWRFDESKGLYGRTSKQCLPMTMIVAAAVLVRELNATGVLNSFITQASAESWRQCKLGTRVQRLSREHLRGMQDDGNFVASIHYHAFLALFSDLYDVLGRLFRFPIRAQGGRGLFGVEVLLSL